MRMHMRVCVYRSYAPGPGAMITIYIYEPQSVKTSLIDEVVKI